MSNGPNLLAQWREARRAYRRAASATEATAAEQRMRQLEAQMTDKQRAQLRETTTEGAS